MPTYDYSCPNPDCPSKAGEERNVPVAERDRQSCGRCGFKLVRRTASPGFKVPGGNSPARQRTDV